MAQNILTLEEIAAYLKIDATTILKMAQEHTIPAINIAGQWRFDQLTVELWLKRTMVENIEQPGQEEQELPLTGIFLAQYIKPALEATTKLEVLNEMATLAHDVGIAKDRDPLLLALIAREKIFSTAILNNTALLHPRQRTPENIRTPAFFLGISSDGIDFDAQDGTKTHIFFLLCLKYDMLHLKYLARISSLFKDSIVREYLLSGTRTSKELYAYLIQQLSA